MAKNDSTRVRAGNYKQGVDLTGLGREFDEVFGTPLSKVEKDYVAGTGGRPSAREAIRRARKANRQPPPKE